MKKLIEIYLQTLDLSKNAKLEKKYNHNEITLLLGLKLPGMKNILEYLRNYIQNNLITQFLKYEKELREITKEDEDYSESIEKYKKKIKNIFKNMEIEIKKNDLFQKLIELEENQKDNKQFYEWLSDDYYLLYLVDIIPDIKNSFNELEDYKKILKKIVNIRFDSENDAEEANPIQFLSMKMVWLECYNNYISILISIYHDISFNIKDLYNRIDNILEKNEIEYEKSNKLPEYVRQINSPFFFIIESILKIYLNDFDFKNLKEEEFNNYIKMN